MRLLGRGGTPPLTLCTREQHFTFTNGFHRVRYVGIQHEGLATGKLMPPSFRVNH
jgi:hypothetical protein